MNAETISASHDSCRSSSHRCRSTNRSERAQTIVSPYVSPIRTKYGSTANDPGAVTRAKVAEPSTIVPIVARTTMSQATLRRSSVSIKEVLGVRVVRVVREVRQVRKVRGKQL